MPYTSNLGSALILLSLLMSSVVLAPKTVAVGQEPIESPLPVLLPAIEVPSSGMAPVYVPADVLLQEADAIRPRSPEGWIIKDVPIDVGYVEVDPAKQAYERFDYPLRLRQYDSQIRVLQAEVYSWRRRLSVYRYFNKTGALFITNENAILALIQSEEQLRNLRYERMLFVREHQRQRHLPATDVVISDSAVGEY